MKMYIKLDELTAPIAYVTKGKVYKVIRRDEEYVYINRDNGCEIGIAYGAVEFVESPLLIKNIVLKIVDVKIGVVEEMPNYQEIYDKINEIIDYINKEETK